MLPKKVIDNPTVQELINLIPKEVTGFSELPFVLINIIDGLEWMLMDLQLEGMMGGSNGPAYAYQLHWGRVPTIEPGNGYLWMDVVMGDEGQVRHFSIEAINPCKKDPTILSDNFDGGFKMSDAIKCVIEKITKVNNLRRMFSPLVPHIRVQYQTLGRGVKYGEHEQQGIPVTSGPKPVRNWIVNGSCPDCQMSKTVLGDGPYKGLCAKCAEAKSGGVPQADREEVVYPRIHGVQTTKGNCSCGTTGTLVFSEGEYEGFCMRCVDAKELKKAFAKETQ